MTTRRFRASADGRIERIGEAGDGFAFDENVLLPPDKPWNGKTVGCYIRNSTAAQVGNDRAAFQADMVPYLHNLGYAVRVYDEQGTSAGTLHRRKKALGMLADLEAGRIDGVAVVEVSRLTRDEYGFDAPLIGEKIRRFGKGLLITYGQTWDLRRESDWQMYQMQTMASGWQKLSIRKYLFQGLKRAAEDRPMFRKKYRLGYKREVVRDSRGEPIIRRNGRVYTVYVRDLGWAETMEALRKELNQQGTIPDVAEALNAAKVPAPWMIRTSGDRVWQWRGMYIRSIITDPLYYGEPAFMTTEPGPVWDQFIAVDPDFDPRKLRWRLPDLAWWTKAETLAWQHKFLDNYVKSRHRKHHHLLLGLLHCQSCGQQMVKSGIDKSGDRYYRCPGYGLTKDDPQHCAGQFLMEKAAFRLLREHALPVIFADVAALIEGAERNASTPQQKFDKRQQLDALNERERNLLATVADRGYTIELKALLTKLDKEKAKLEAELEANEQAVLVSEETRRRIRALADDPLAFYDVRTEVQKAAILRLLLADVTIQTNRRRGTAHRWLAPKWRPLVTTNSDTCYRLS